MAKQSNKALVVSLLVGFLLVAAYFLLRYKGYWAENDTAELTRIVRTMMASGALIPEQESYSFGYGYPVVSTWITQITGLSVRQYQQLLSIILAAWIVFPAYMAYSVLTRTALGGAIATAILLTQPDFIFALMRGTHEKYTRGLMLLCIFLIVRSITSQDSSKRLTSIILSLCLVIFALITMNVLLANSFILAIALALLLHFVITSRYQNNSENLYWVRRRLLFVLIVSMVLVFMFIFYFYEPARSGLYLLDSALDRFLALFLQVDEISVSSYEGIQLGWRDISSYVLVSWPTWLLLISSFLLWSGATFFWMVKKKWPQETSTNLLWSFYGAFAFMGAVSILADFANVLGGSLQARMVPAILMMAAPLVAHGLEKIQPGTRGKTLLNAGLALLITAAGVVSLLKITNEPMLSNNWVYYRPAEIEGLSWIDGHSKYQTIWTDFNERLITSYEIAGNTPGNENELDAFQIDEFVSLFSITDVVRARSKRIEQPLPIDYDALHIYGNGHTDIFRRRPDTPYQN